VDIKLKHHPNWPVTLKLLFSGRIFHTKCNKIWPNALELKDATHRQATRGLTWRYVLLMRTSRWKSFRLYKIWITDDEANRL